MKAASPSALIAEDEPLLARALLAELARAWPELKIVASVGDGVSAVAQALQLQPDVLFFDIQMPGLNGLQAAAELADAWDMQAEPHSRPFPVLVFVTAYDQYAVQAFEAQALDYLLKPVQAARLQKTVAKVQATLLQRAQAAISPEANTASMEHTLGQLRALLAPQLQPLLPPSPALQIIQATQPGSQGNTIRMIPVAEVVFFEAADKYIRVLTASAEYLIRTPLKDLLLQLDAHTFWQVHRGTVVRASAIESVARDEGGRLTLSLRGRADKIVVSRLYSHLFKPM